MGSWFLASSAPLGLAVFFTTPWKLTSGVLHSLSSMLIRAWLIEAHFSLLLPTGHSEDPSVQSPVFLGPPSQLAAPPSLAAIVRGLSRSVGHDLQRVSSSQASALFQFSPCLLPLFLSAAHFLLSLFHPGKVPVLLQTRVVMSNQDPGIKERESGLRVKESTLQKCCQGHHKCWAGCVCWMRLDEAK